MPELSLPPDLRALVDQAEAADRDHLATALKVYREHVNTEHGGDPSPCARAFVMSRHIGLDGAARLTPHQTHSLLAYAVERLYLLEIRLAEAEAEAEG